MKKIANLKGRLDQYTKKPISKQKHDPWASAETPYSYHTTLSNAGSTSTQDAGKYWSSSPAAIEGIEEGRRRAAEAGEPLPSTPPHKRVVPHSEDSQFQMAIALSLREEEERMRTEMEDDKELQAALELSRKEVRTVNDPFAAPLGHASGSHASFSGDPFAPSPAQQSTTAALQANVWAEAADAKRTSQAVPPISNNELGSLYFKERALAEEMGEQEVQSHLAKQEENDAIDSALKEDWQQQRMIGYGFAGLHRLWGVGDCAVLVCHCVRLLKEGQLAYRDIKARFGSRAVDVSGERRSLLQFLYDNADSISRLQEPLMMEATTVFGNVADPMERIRKYLTKMANNQEYFGITEMAAGAYRDNYILVFLRERPSNLGGGLDVSGMAAPAGAKDVYYCLFYDTGHYDLLEPLPIKFSDVSLFAGAPPNLQETLESLYKEQVQSVASSPSASSGPHVTAMQPLRPTPVGMAAKTPPAKSVAVTKQEPLDVLGQLSQGNDLWSRNKDFFKPIKTEKKPQAETLASLAAQKKGGTGAESLVQPLGQLSLGSNSWQSPSTRSQDSQSSNSASMLKPTLSNHGDLHQGNVTMGYPSMPMRNPITIMGSSNTASGNLNSSGPNYNIGMGTPSASMANVNMANRLAGVGIGSHSYSAGLTSMGSGNVTARIGNSSMGAADTMFGANRSNPANHMGWGSSATERTMAPGPSQTGQVSAAQWTGWPTPQQQSFSSQPRQ